ncbi:peptidoglycan DD-metalloendopeptidase family protein [Patescibacteria group bacterium]|nr:peptidoglycan DD-metalloendopeptidase family protein [Patescibacteria group bacterium]
MSGVSYLFKGLGLLLYWSAIKPIFIVSHWLLHSVLSRVYLNIYFPIKKFVILKFSNAKSKVWYPFATRYIVHGFIILIAAGVLIHSIQTREVYAEEFANDSLVSKILGNSNQEIITETAEDAVNMPTSYLNYKGLVGGASGLAQDTTVDETDQSLALTQGSGTIVKPNIPTTDLGDRVRDVVEYYIVEQGDTISTIAEDYNVSTNTILWENKLGEKDYIKPGDKLTILPMSGVSHQVKNKDTISSIASKYKIEADKIIEYNKLASADDITVNQILIIPGGQAPEAVKIISPSNTIDKYFSGSPPPPARVVSSEKMLWPTPSHKINQYYTWRHHGVDIDGDYSSPIYAAESGTIANVGWGTGYGLHVIINHGGGKKTVYAHLSKSYVNAGQSVSTGDTLGMMGCTGWCTGTHLHFEVQINGSKVNPLSYL